MGLLNIFKGKPKASKVAFEDLDLPPAPPVIEDMDVEAPSVEHEDFLLPPPPSPQKVGFSKAPMPESDLDFELPYNEEIKDDDIDIPELPKFPDDDLEEEPAPQEAEEDMPEIELQRPSLPPMPSMPMIPRIPKPASTPSPMPFMRSNAPSGIFRSGTRLYVKLDKFKESLIDMNAIRSKIKDSQSTFHKLEEIWSSKERSLSAFNSAIMDLQKKLTHIDKKLFREGD